MLDPVVIDAMVASGCSIETLAAAVKADAVLEREKMLERRYRAAMQQRRYRAKIRQQKQQSRSEDTSGHLTTPLPPCPPLDKERSPVPPKEITPPLNPPTPIFSAGEFEIFWKAYPLKVGKAAARKAFAKTKEPLSDLLAALDRYRVGKPVDQAFCHPATWLNGERWHDQYGPVTAPQTRQPSLFQQRQNEWSNRLGELQAYASSPTGGGTQRGQAEGRYALAPPPPQELPANWEPAE